MKNKIIKIILLLVLCFPLLIKAENLEIYSKSVLLYNLNDSDILYSKNQNNKTAIASLTKIMTTLVAIENIKNLDEFVTFPNIDMSRLYDYSKVGLTKGDKVTYRDLLYGTLIASGADASLGVATLVSNSEKSFVDLMNKKADDLKLKNTKFSNTFGMDSVDNYSTANDLLTILKHALKNKTFYEIYTSKYYTLTNGKKINSTLSYYSKKNDIDVTGIIGSKTGYTNDAGLCMASIFKIGKVNLLLITLNAPANTGYSYQVIDAVKIYDYFFNNYEYQTILKKKENLVDIKINKLFNIHKIVYSDESVEKFLPKNSEVKKEYLSRVKNIETGIVIGKYTIKYEDKVLYSKDIIIEDNFKNNFWIFMDKYIIYISILVLIFISILIIKSNKCKQNVFDINHKTF